MKNILIVSTSYPNSKNIASGIFIRNLAEAIADNPLVSTVKIVAPSVTGNLSFSRNPQRVPVEYFRYAPNRLETLAQLPGGIPASLRANPARLFLVPGFLLGMFVSIVRNNKSRDAVLAQWSISGFVACMVCVFTGTTVITTLHGEDVRNALKKMHFRIILRIVVRFSAKVVCVSQEMKEILTDLFPDYKDKYCYISNGISSELFNIKKSSLPNTVEPLRIILIASLIPIKSINHAIEALKRLIKDNNYSVTLTIAGDGDLKDELSAQIEEEAIADSVTLLGIVDQTSLIEEFRKNDLMLITSKEEGRSTVVLEAMAASLPVLGSNVRGIREILSASPGGLLYEYADIDQLCAQLSDIYHNRNALQINGEKNRQWIKNERLSWPEIANKYLETIK